MEAHTYKKREKGFSFLEALFALLILSVGFSGILSLYSLMNENTSNDELKLVASKLASEKIEQVLANKANLGYSNISTGTTTDAITYDNLNFSRQTNINYVESTDLSTVSGSDTGFKKIDVTVNWSNGSNQNVTVQSLISNH